LLSFVGDSQFLILMLIFKKVEMARRYLQATACYQTIRAAEVRDERILAKVSATEFEEALAGKQFHCAMRHGKRLFLKLHDSLWLALHLGLTGRLIYLENGAEEPRHTRLLISFRNGRNLGFEDPQDLRRGEPREKPRCLFGGAKDRAGCSAA